jgi:uncharacterized membrane protein
MKEALKKNIMVGLIFLAPFLITTWVLLSVIQFLDSKIYSLFPFTVQIPGLGLVAGLGLVILAGAIARTFFGRFLNQIVDSLFSRVPVVRALYSGIKQVSNTVFAGEGNSKFQSVVLVPFPAPPSRAIAFVAGRYSETESLIFVPTAPNPTSGYVIVMKDSDIETSGLTVDEAFKIVVSCGFLSKNG